MFEAKIMRNFFSLFTVGLIVYALNTSASYALDSEDTRPYFERNESFIQVIVFTLLLDENSVRSVTPKRISQGVHAVILQINEEKMRELNKIIESVNEARVTISIGGRIINNGMRVSGAGDGEIALGPLSQAEADHIISQFK